MDYRRQIAQQEPQVATWLAIAEGKRQRSRNLARLGLGFASLSVATGILTPVLGWPAVLPPVMGAAASILALSLERGRSKINRRVAEIKDSIDSALYGLPPSFLNRRAVTAEEIASLGVMKEQERDRYTNWYPRVDQLPQGYQVLVWQRSSAVWDIDLRNAATIIAYSAAAILALGSLASAYAYNMAVPDYLARILLPTLPLFITCIQAAQRNSDAAKSRLEIKELIDSVWSNALAHSRNSLDANTAYVIKDGILQARRTASPIARLLEAISHRRLYARMQSSASLMEQEYLNSSTSALTTPE